MSTSDGCQPGHQTRTASVGDAVLRSIRRPAMPTQHLAAGNQNCAGLTPSGTQLMERAQELSARENGNVQD